MNHPILQWLAMALGAFGVGLSKTAIAGFGIAAVAIFAIAVPARLSTGLVLPLLITGDIMAVSIYKRKAVWSHLITLFPWAAVGVVAGYFALGKISSHEVAHLIGGILIVLTSIQLVRRFLSNRSGAAEPFADIGGVRQALAVVAIMGMLAGFTTMVANAAGPVMILYLLATRLPKQEFIGTSAWFFFFLNLFKVPFSVKLGLINMSSLPTDACLIPLVVAGAFVGRALLNKLDQRLFENLALGLTLLAGIELLVR